MTSNWSTPFEVTLTFVSNVFLKTAANPRLMILILLKIAAVQQSVHSVLLPSIMRYINKSRKPQIDVGGGMCKSVDFFFFSN